MISAAHAVFGLAATIAIWRALAQVWVDELTPEPVAREAIRLAIPAMSLAASALAITAGRVVGRARQLFLYDALAYGLLLILLFALSLGRIDRDYIGILFVLAVVVRFTAAVMAGIESGRLPLLFASALLVYAAFAAWHQATSLPLGDQVHYLLTADGLARGRVDATINIQLFRQLSTLTPSDLDAGTHVLDAPVGPRAIQGYALPLVLLPGWLIAGRFGAELVVALVGAAAAVMTALILRDTVGSARVRGLVWMITTFLAPTVLLAFHIYPNIFGAAALGAAYRFAFTAPRRRPLIAGIAGGLTLFLNPRDGLVLAVLVAALVWLARTDVAARVATARFTLGAAVVAIVASISNALLYGLPFPYAGYALGVLHAQELTRESTLSFQFWIGLPAMLFDRTFGIAGVAPWMFVGLVGLPAALRAEPRLAPAAWAIGASLVFLSIYRYWEGGYAPAARYFVDEMPVFAPFVAFGLAVARDAIGRAITAVLVAVSAVATVVLLAMPYRALNDAFQHQLQDVLAQVLGLNPIGWLPSFQPTTPDWYIGATWLLVPAVLFTVGLAGYGWLRRSPNPFIPAVPMASGALRLDTVTFTVANAAALAWSVYALTQPWVGELGDVPTSLATRWLPYALAIATVLALVVGTHLETHIRQGYFARHFAVYIAVPLTLAALRSQFLIDVELGVAYIAIAAGLAGNALHALWQGLDRPTDTRVALVIGAVVLAAALVVLPYDRTTSTTASDEPHYLLIVQSIVFDRDLDLANDYAGQRYFDFYPEPLPDVHGIYVGPSIYPIRDLGLPVLAAVPYALAGRTGVLALMCIFGAILAAQLYLLLRDLAFDRRVAFLAVAATALVHPFLTYTTQIYPDLIAATIFVTVARLVRRGRGTSVRELALASALTGTLPWLSTRVWFLAIGLGLVIAYCALWSRREITRRAADIVIRFVAGAVPFLALVALVSYVNWRMFAFFMPSAGYFLIRGQQEVVSYTVHSGLTGLLFDRAFGLVPRAPIYLLAFLGVAAIWRRRGSAELAALFAGWALYLLFIASVAYWYADGGPPSRYLLAGLPLLVVGVAGGIELVRSQTGVPRTALVLGAWIVALWSAFIAFVYAVAPHLRYEYVAEVRSGGQIKLWEEVGRLVRPDVQFALPSLYGGDALTLALVAMWTAGALSLALIGLRAQPRATATTASASSAGRSSGTL